MAFELEIMVSAHDIDANCTASPTSVIRYMMEAVDRNMLVCGPAYQELMEKGLSFIVSRSAVEILRPIKEYEKLTVSTWASESKNVSFPRSYVIKSGEEIVAKGLSIWALLDVNNGKLIRGSEFSVKSYGVGEAVELSVPYRFKIPVDTPMTLCGMREVRYSDVDRNLHMNNTKYFDMLFDFIPERAKIYMSSCLVSYISEAPLGGTLNIYISNPETNENGETLYYFKTEIDGKTNIEAKVGVRYI